MQTLSSKDSFLAPVCVCQLLIIWKLFVPVTRCSSLIFLESHQTHRSDWNHFHFFTFESQAIFFIFFSWMVTTQLSKYLLTVLGVVLIISLFELWLKKCLLPSVSSQRTCRYRDGSLLEMPVGTIIRSHYVWRRPFVSVLKEKNKTNKHHTKAHPFFFFF